MDTNLKTKWVEALRSGEYKQGRFLLYNEIENAYCCLGVLCKVHEPKFTPGVEIAYTAINGLGVNESLQNDFMIMNDTLVKSFSEIATYIERNL